MHIAMQLSGDVDGCVEGRILTPTIERLDVEIGAGPKRPMFTLRLEQRAGDNLYVILPGLGVTALPYLKALALAAGNAVLELQQWIDEAVEATPEPIAAPPVAETETVF